MNKELKQEERYKLLYRLTKDDLIKIIIDNQCLVSDKWLDSLTTVNIPFSQFWEAYGYKKWSKTEAEKKWNKLTNKERTDAMIAVEFYKKERKPEYIAMPQTWIHQKRWESIIEEHTELQQPKTTKREFHNWPLQWDLWAL